MLGISNRISYVLFVILLFFFFYDRKAPHPQMKHIFKIAAILVAISAIWIALLETSTVPRSYTWLVSVTDFC
jgi:uncharacterized membrane-anchored protein